MLALRDATLILMTANTPDIPKSSHAMGPPPLLPVIFGKMAEVYRVDSPGDPIPFCSQDCPWHLPQTFLEHIQLGCLQSFQGIPQPDARSRTTGLNKATARTNGDWVRPQHGTERRRSRAQKTACMVQSHFRQKGQPITGGHEKAGRRVLRVQGPSSAVGATSYCRYCPVQSPQKYLRGDSSLCTPHTCSHPGNQADP